MANKTKLNKMESWWWTLQDKNIQVRGCPDTISDNSTFIRDTFWMESKSNLHYFNFDLFKITFFLSISNFFKINFSSTKYYRHV